MNTALKVSVGIVAGFIGGLLFTAIATDGQLGGTYSNVTKYFTDGISVGTSGQFTVSSEGAVTTSGALTTTGNATVSGGTFTVTTADSATSTTAIGCLQTTATSTATPIRIVLGKVGSGAGAGATTTLNGATGQGALYWAYGTCPNSY